MKIFLSHIHEEKPLGVVLKDWIESTLNGNVEIFLSSDVKDNPAGGRWLDKVSKELEECNGMIILCTKESVRRPWINFESGCGWVKKIPIIPICFNGLEKASLPVPLSEFQALDLLDKDFINDLFLSFQKLFGISKIPRIAKDEMIKEINESLKSIHYSLSVKTLELAKEEQREIDLDILETNILKVFSEEDDRIVPGYFEGRLKEKLIKINHSLSSLMEKGLLYKNDLYGYFYLSDEGRKYIIENILNS